MAEQLRKFAEALDELEDTLETEYLERSCALDDCEEQVRERITVMMREQGAEPEDEEMSLKPPDPELAEARKQTEEIRKQLERSQTALLAAQKSAKDAEEEAAKGTREAEQRRQEALEASALVEKLQKEQEAQAKAAAEAAEDSERKEVEESKKAAEKEEAKAETERWHNIELDPDALPDVSWEEDVFAQRASVYDAAYQLLQQVRWMSGIQISFALLNLPLADIKTMLGEQWQTVYPSDPTEEAVVHPQVLKCLATALEGISKKYLEQRSAEQRKLAVQAAKDALKEEAAKRRRTH